MADTSSMIVGTTSRTMVYTRDQMHYWRVRNRGPASVTVLQQEVNAPTSQWPLEPGDDIEILAFRIEATAVATTDNANPFSHVEWEPRDTLMT